MTKQGKIPIPEANRSPTDIWKYSAGLLIAFLTPFSAVLSVDLVNSATQATPIVWGGLKWAATTLIAVIGVANIVKTQGVPTRKDKGARIIAGAVMDRLQKTSDTPSNTAARIETEVVRSIIREAAATDRKEQP